LAIVAGKGARDGAGTGFWGKESRAVLCSLVCFAKVRGKGGCFRSKNHRPKGRV